MRLACLALCSLTITLITAPTIAARLSLPLVPHYEAPFPSPPITPVKPPQHTGDNNKGHPPSDTRNQNGEDKTIRQQLAATYDRTFDHPGVFSGLVACLTAIAAMLTAGGTLLTVRQMQRQMAASYRPELTFARVFVSCRAKAPRLPLPTFWKPQGVTSEEGEQERDTSVTEDQFSMNIYNVGLGVATNVRIIWGFPVEDMVTKINQLTSQTLTPAYFDYHKTTGWLHLKSTTWQEIAFSWNVESKTSLDYVLPESVKQTGVQLKLPLTFIYLSMSYLFMQIVVQTGEKTVDMPDVPPLNVQLLYQDVSGAEHRAAFNLQFHPGMIVGSPPMEIHGYIEPVRLL
jgi:hypothetical protein